MPGYGEIFPSMYKGLYLHDRDKMRTKGQRYYPLSNNTLLGPQNATGALVRENYFWFLANSCVVFLISTVFENRYRKCYFLSISIGT